MNYLYYGGMGYGPWGGFGPFLGLLVLWSLFWKALALWHSAQRKQGWWFLALMFINTAGILEIIYLFAIAKIPAKDLFPKKK